MSATILLSRIKSWLARKTRVLLGVLPKGELYHLAKDWSEESDLAADHSQRVKAMTRELMAHLDSMQKSHAGEDYSDPSFSPQDDWDAFRTRPELKNRKQQP